MQPVTIQHHYRFGPTNDYKDYAEINIFYSYKQFVTDLSKAQYQVGIVCDERVLEHHTVVDEPCTKRPSEISSTYTSNTKVMAYYIYFFRVMVLDWDLHHGNDTQSILEDD
ncbi:hypothetical protein TKK_0002269 [Trichogramma kaykai]